MQNTLVICSGGLDSTTLSYLIHRDKHKKLSLMLSFDYGQTHRKELDYAKQCADDLDTPHQIVDIRSIGSLLQSSLTNSSSIPDGHYTEKSMSSTVVPNRNAIMLCIAYGLADSMDLDAVAIAVHGGDHHIYPDCRPAFIEQFSAMQAIALDRDKPIQLFAPFLQYDKSDIAKLGKQLSVAFETTWSCYKGGQYHCGRCGTCVERLEAMHLANVEDKTIYQDKEFWKTISDSRAT